MPVANAEFLHARLPNSRLDVLDTGHLAWEEAPGEYGAIIAAWVNGGYLAGIRAGPPDTDRLPGYAGCGKSVSSSAVRRRCGSGRRGS